MDHELIGWVLVFIFIVAGAVILASLTIGAREMYVHGNLDPDDDADKSGFLFSPPIFYGAIIIAALSVIAYRLIF
jgi:hypothetical protein